MRKCCIPYIPCRSLLLSTNVLNDIPQYHIKSVTVTVWRVNFEGGKFSRLSRILLHPRNLNHENFNKFHLMVLANTSELASVERKAPMVDLSVYSIVTDFSASPPNKFLEGGEPGGTCV